MAIFMLNFTEIFKFLTFLTYPFICLYLYRYFKLKYAKPSFTVNIRNNKNLPSRATVGSVGWDVYSNQNITIMPGTRCLVPTGYYLENITPNYFIRIAPRSGLAVSGIDIGAGIIDNDYQGEIKVLLINNSPEAFKITSTVKIAQLVVEKCNLTNYQFKLKNKYYP